MTTHDLGHDLGPDLGAGPGPGPGAGPGAGESGLEALFDLSPARPVHTSAAAETALLAGLLGMLAMPFSLTVALCLGLSVVALVTSVIGMARASRPGVAGGLLASVGMVLSLATLALVGLRYVGLDTAFGDSLALAEWLGTLNDLVPSP